MVSQTSLKMRTKIRYRKDRKDLSETFDEHKRNVHYPISQEMHRHFHYIYRTQVNLGSDLRVRLSVRLSVRQLKVI